MKKKDQGVKGWKNKIKKRKYIIIGGVVLIVVVALLSGNGNQAPDYVVVERGDLAQEIFETGSTEKGENVNLGFKEGGRIESILAKEGEIVSRGSTLALLDRKEVEISLREAEAALVSTEASLERFLAGATTEERGVAQAVVVSAENTLSSAKDSLEDQKRNTEEALRTAYQSVPTLLGEVFSTAKEVKIGVDDIASTYFVNVVVPETTSGRRSRTEIRRITERIEQHKEMAMEEEVSFSEKESALKETRGELRKIIYEIDNIISVADSDFYKDKFSETDKGLLRSYRSSINTALSEVVSLLGTISSVNTAEDAKLTVAENSVKAAESALLQAQKDSARIKAPPQSADVRVRDAAVEQARARVELLRARVNDTSMRSPVSGTVSAVLSREGEVVVPGSSVFVIVPEKEIQIAVNIYEGDIPKISVGNEVKASFVAFPNIYFKGEVASINPTGKMIDGVVYYSIKIVLDEYPERTLPQMTVDVTIKTAEKNGVLLIPERSIRRREGKQIVAVIENGERVEREITTGLRGEGRMVEVISGLQEGERVLIE